MQAATRGWLAHPLADGAGGLIGRQDALAGGGDGLGGGDQLRRMLRQGVGARGGGAAMRGGDDACGTAGAACAHRPAVARARSWTPQPAARTQPPAAGGPPSWMGAGRGCAPRVVLRAATITVSEALGAGWLHPAVADRPQRPDQRRAAPQRRAPARKTRRAPVAAMAPAPPPRRLCQP